MSPTTATASLRLERLEIREYRSLRRVEWPSDGLGWKGIPDIVLVGGLNGSGKTTLLELLFDAARFTLGWGIKDPQEAALSLLPRGSQRVQLALEIDTTTYNLDVSSDTNLSENLGGPHTWNIWVPPPDETERAELNVGFVEAAHRRFARLATAPSGPSLLYFPTERNVPFPAAQYKYGGRSASSRREPVFRYRASQEWEKSTEAVLYDARWRDLNAKEQGHPEAAIHFAGYEQAMRRFFGEGKRLTWDVEGLLSVKTRHGDEHPLNALSSGEKQILLFVAELLRRWTPGSLVLIDEPELHLHESWLANLWRLVYDLQRERGGQVILTTQSDYLFSLGEPGTRVLLGGGLR
jgi:ABC-type transport system involved in cytochrome c biogenesis ATPase subunit